MSGFFLNQDSKPLVYRKHQEEPEGLSSESFLTLRATNRNSPAQRKQQRLGMVDGESNDGDENNNNNSNTNSFNMCQSLLSALHVLFHLIFTKTLHNRNCCCIHDRDKKTKA